MRDIPEDCSQCNHNKTIVFHGPLGEVYVPICAKAFATRAVADLKPHWCPLDGTGDPYPYLEKNGIFSKLFEKVKKQENQIDKMKNCYNCQHLRQYGLLRTCRKHNGTYTCLSNNHALWELIKDEREPCR